MLQERTGDRVRIKVSIDQTTKPQPIKRANLPKDQKLSVVDGKLTGDGVIEVDLKSSMLPIKGTLSHNGTNTMSARFQGRDMKIELDTALNFTIERVR